MVGFAQPMLTGRYSAASALRTLLCSVAAYSLTSSKVIGPTTRGWVLVAHAFKRQTNPQTANALLKPILTPCEQRLTLCARPTPCRCRHTTPLLLHSTHRRFSF